MTLYLMQGLPASGKTTASHLLTDTVRVCRDDLRMMLHGSYWTGEKEREREVSIAEDALVHRFLTKELSVVVDATNLSPDQMEKWSRIGLQHGNTVFTVRVKTALETCIARDAWRAEAGQRHVGEEKLREIALKYPQRKWPVAGTLVEVEQEI